MTTRYDCEITLHTRGHGTFASDRYARTIPGAFARQVARDPSAVAVIAGDTVLRYRDLDILSDRLAAGISAQGAGPDDIVALAFPRSAGLIVAMLAVVKAGAAYLPLDIRQPVGRTEFMLRDSGARLLVTSHDNDGDHHGLPVLGVEPATGRSEAPGPGFSLVQVDLDPGDLAVAIYTSGSTGTPKAVAMTHANMIAQTCPSVAIPFAPGQRMLNLGAPAFDVTGLEIWGPLLNGACVVVATQAMPSAEEIAALIESERIDSAWFTAGLFRTLAETNPYMFRGLRTVASGGDVVSPAAVRAVRAVCPELEIINGYGPTEATILCARHVIRPCDLNADRLPIGQALPGYRLLILDEALSPVAAGAIGELCIAGDGVAIGYLGRPELTAERFVACPFGPAGARMYRTGDLARWNDDGTIDFLGRNDFQIKLREYRIEAGEVESALVADPSVAQAIVLAREIAGEKRLLAYLVPRDDKPAIDIGALRAALLTRLPDFMVPSALIVIEQLPLTSNGKVDRAALPDPVLSIEGGEEPRTPAEAMICGLFAELTGHQRVSRDDNFFDIGGTSLIAMRLGSAISQRTGISLPLFELYQSPTPAGIARCLQHRPAWSPLVPIQPNGTRPSLFCLHPASGVAISYKVLADAMGPDQPVWGLQARGMDLPNDPHCTVREMAVAYRAAIRTVQPTGPYHLLGWSLGGIVAQEMACQWEAEGETVARVVMLDAMLPAYIASDPFGEVRFAQSLLAAMVAKNEAERTRQARLLVLAVTKRGLMPPDTPPEWAERMLIQITNAQPMVTAHLPSTCDADILLFRADAEVTRTHDDAYAWDELCRGRIRQIRLPCPHNLMLEPAMAARIAQGLLV